MIFEQKHGSLECPKIQRLRDCRTAAWFVRHEETGIVRVAAKQCRLRWCPMCANARQAFLTSQTLAWLDTTDHPKLLTVTLKHSKAPLAWQIENLYDYFRKFRKRSYLHDRISGGIWFFQIKRSKADGLWHPHIHALIDGDYLDCDKLRKLWKQITFGSFVVDIKSVHDKDNAARHVARYAAKPCNLLDFSLKDGIEIVNALERKRIVGTWGSARKISLRPKKPDDADKWINIGSWSIVHEMQGYDFNADEIVHAYRTGDPLDQGISMRTLERSIAGQLDYEIDKPVQSFQQTFFD